MDKRILIGLGIAAVFGGIYLITQNGSSFSDPMQQNAARELPESTSLAADSKSPSELPPPSTPVESKGGRLNSPATPEILPSPATRIGDKLYLSVPITLLQSIHSDSTSPADDVAAIGTALNYYRQVFKENPTGSLNLEILSQLTGGNPKGVVVVPPDHPDINEQGELMDRWGTPYFFHGISRTSMDVWSAGPDRNFGSIDDIKLGVD